VRGTSELPTPEEISVGAMDRGDSRYVVALDLFIECLGSVAGDHALSVLALGGVYLTGGVIARIEPWLHQPKFRAAFCAKSPHSDLLARIPVIAVKNERAALLGAARIACEA
jgi:glucokinase